MQQKNKTDSHVNDPLYHNWKLCFHINTDECKHMRMRVHEFIYLFQSFAKIVAPVSPNCQKMARYGMFMLCDGPDDQYKKQP